MAEDFTGERSNILFAHLENHTLDLFSDRQGWRARRSIPIGLIGPEEKPRLVYLLQGEDTSPGVYVRTLEEGGAEFYDLSNPAISQLDLKAAIAVSPDGRYVAIPLKCAEIVVLDRQTQTLKVIQFGYGHQNVRELKFFGEILRGVNTEGKIFEVNVNPSRP